MAATYDPLSDDFRQGRLDVYRALREEAPVYLDPAGRFAALSRFDDVRAAAADWKTFSALTAEASILHPVISSMDPPLHTDRRSNLARVHSSSGGGSRTTPSGAPRSLIAAFADRGTCDFVKEFAALFPSMVMGELLGLPDEVLDECRSITDDIMRVVVPEGNRPTIERADAVFAPLIAARRAEPRDDLISALLAVGDDGGEPLSEEEILGFCWLLLVGGNDTTTNLLGNGIDLLDQYPDQRAELVADPSLIPGAIDEMLRHSAPTQNSWRQSTRDITLHGVTIPADMRVILLWGAANHDEREFTDPERFDIHRAPERHLSFGHGTHFCMGAALARLESRVAFEEILAAIPEYRVVERSERILSTWAWGYESLRLEF